MFATLIELLVVVSTNEMTRSLIRLESMHTYTLMHLSLIYTITLEVSQKATFGENRKFK